MRIYRLISSDPPLEGIGYRGPHPDSGDFYRALGRFKGESVASTWHQFQLQVSSEPGYNEDKPDPPADCPHHGNQTVVLKTQAAVDGLRPLLEPWGELLQANISTGPVWFFNGLHVLDALDLDATRASWFDDGIRIMDIKKYAFRPEAVGSTRVFKTEHYRMQLHFTGEFVDDAMALGLSGLNFRLLWTDEAEFLNQQWTW